MKKIVLIFFSVWLFGANLINVNFFENKNKIDILFSLDDTFKGKVKQISKNSYLITNISTDRVVQKEFNNNFLNSIIISPDGNNVKIDITTQNKIKISVATTPDGYGVRFRIMNATPVKNEKVMTLQNMTSKETKSLDFISYIVGLVVLFILAVVLWFLKKKAVHLPKLKEDMKVLAQKPIDAKNKVVLFEYQKRKYLMLIGNTNVLLDVFVNDIAVPKNEVEFDEMLKLNQKYDTQINKYIKNAEKLKDFDETI